MYTHKQQDDPILVVLRDAEFAHVSMVVAVADCAAWLP